MGIFGKFLAAATIGAGPFALSASPALAAQPQRAVTCVYEAMPTEIRGLIDNLFETVWARGEDPLKNEDVRTAVGAHIAAARETCIDLYPLTSGESEISGSFAYVSLIADFTAKLIEKSAGDAEDITLYFQVNRTRLPLTRIPTAAEIAAEKARMPADWPPMAKDQLARRVFHIRARSPSKLEVASLVASLKAKGWRFDRPDLEPLAAMYLELQMQLALDRRAYANGDYER